MRQFACTFFRKFLTRPRDIHIYSRSERSEAGGASEASGASELRSRASLWWVGWCILHSGVLPCVRPSVPELISTMTEPILMSDGLSERYLAGEETKFFFFRKKIFFKSYDFFEFFEKNFFLQISFLVGLYGGPGCALQN